MIANMPHDQQTAPRTGLRRWRVGTHMQQSFVLAALLIVCYSFFRQVPVWNEWSRFDLVRAIVDDGTLSIDRYHENTGDKAFYDGHYYSDKMPGSALVGVPVYALIRGADALVGSPALDDDALMAATAFFLAGVPTIITALLLLHMLRSLTDERWALLVTVAYALGTIAFPFATMFFGHALSASLLFASFWLLWRSRDDRSMLMPSLAGLAAGWAVLTEIPVVLGAIILLAYCAWQRPRRAFPFVLGGLPTLLVLMGYNWLAFDHPLRLGYQFTTNFAEQNSQGIVSIVLPRWSTAIDLLLAPRGLLRLSPWLALAPLGLLALRRRDQRTPVVVCGAIVAAILLYNSGALAPFGGWTPGPRYLTPALPFAAILVAVAPLAFRPVVTLLVACSIPLVTIATATMPNAPEAHADPTGDLWFPRLVSHDLATTPAWTNWGMHGIAPLILLGAIIALALVALWTTTRRTSIRLFAPIMTLLLLVFALRLLVPGASFAGSQTDVTLVDGDAAYLRSDDGDRFAIWTQIANGNAAMDDATVLFQVFNEAGDEVWAGWQDGVSLPSRDHQRISMEWLTEDTAPGAYRVDVALVSRDHETTFARTEGIAHVVVHAPPSDE